MATALIRNTNIQCVFCQQVQLSSKDLKEHLLLCGNKTDQCPNCRKFIRRAIFAYHYENNCADLDEFETTNKNVRSEKHDFSLDFKECPYCQNRCTSNDYQTHLKFCLKKPLERNEDLVYIPCEICNEKIDFNSWSIHTEDCRKKEIQRIQTRAEAISRQPINERYPCEFCEQLFSFIELRTHEILCEKNPRYKSSISERNLRPLSERSSVPISLSSTSQISSRTENDSSTRREELLRSHLTLILDQRRIDEQPVDSNDKEVLVNSAYDDKSFFSPNFGRPLPPRPRTTTSLDRRTKDRDTTKSPMSHSSCSRTSLNPKPDYLSTADNIRSNPTDRDVLFHSSREEDRTYEPILHPYERSRSKKFFSYLNRPLWKS